MRQLASLGSHPGLGNQAPPQRAANTRARDSSRSGGLIGRRHLQRLSGLPPRDPTLGRCAAHIESFSALLFPRLQSRMQLLRVECSLVLHHTQYELSSL